MDQSGIASTQYAQFAKLAFVLVVLFLMTGCISHRPVAPDTNCDLPIGEAHASGGLNFTKLNDQMCEMFTFFCKTRVTRKAILQPAEIDITGYKNIAFAEIEGNAGADFSSALMEQMVKNKALHVVDRTQLTSLLSEIEIEQEDLFDSSSRAKLGKLLPGTILVIGEVNYDYKEHVDDAIDNCVDPSTQSMKRCTKSTRTGSAAVRGQIHFTETETGRQIQVKRISTSATASTEVITGSPPQISLVELNDQAVTKAADDVIRSIIPTKQDRTLLFYVHSDVKKLDRGIREAKAGKLENAKKFFAEAIADIESDPTMNNTALGAAKFNLGVILMYERKHDEAEKLFSGVEDVALGEFPVPVMRRTNDCLKQKDEELQTGADVMSLTRKKYVCG
ncbi:CsgG/HfaB family protein [Nitrospira sp. M1]